MRHFQASDKKYWIPYNLIIRWKASVDKDAGVQIVVDCKDFRSLLSALCAHARAVQTFC